MGPADEDGVPLATAPRGPDEEPTPRTGTTWAVDGGCAGIAVLLGVFGGAVLPVLATVPVPPHGE
jgi:hypothetical protein